MTTNRREFMASMSLLGVALASWPRLAGARVNAAAKRKPKEIKTGGVRMITVDGKYQVWTKKIGSGGPKVLTLHGGPGITHEYFECFEDFLPGHGVELYYYDQLGSAYSDQPDDTSLWTIDRFREEVEQVRAALGLDQFYLYGHSWGAMLGMEYALKYQQHLKGFIWSNMTASIPSYMKGLAALRKKLPAKTQKIMDKYEAAGDFHAPEYEAIMFGEIYAKHLLRLDPWPEPAMRAFKHLNGKVYETMQGPNEFVINGNFKDWDRWADLPKITVPTQVFGAKHDTMTVDDMKKVAKGIPRSRLTILANGSHCSMWDDQEAYFQALLAFIDDVEAGKFPA